MTNAFSFCSSTLGSLGKHTQLRSTKSFSFLFVSVTDLWRKHLAGCVMAIFSSGLCLYILLMFWMRFWIAQRNLGLSRPRALPWMTVLTKSLYVTMPILWWQSICSSSFCEYLLGPVLPSVKGSLVPSPPSSNPCQTLQKSTVPLSWVSRKSVPRDASKSRVFSCLTICIKWWGVCSDLCKSSMI